MNHPNNWTTEDDRVLDKALKECLSLPELCARLTKHFGWAVTADAIRSRCRRRGLQSPGLTMTLNARQLIGDRKSDETEAPRATVVDVPVRPTVTVADQIGERRLRGQLRDLESVNKRLLDELADRDEQLNVFREIRRAPGAPIKAPSRLRKPGDKRIGTPVMVLSDMHVEEPVDPATVNGLNEYNLNIAEKCIDRCAEAFEWFIADSRYDCRTAIVAILGDTFSGHIHDELMEHNFLSPTQAVAWLLPRLEAMLRKMLAGCDCERLVVVCCDGNHGRLTHKTRIATRTANSLEWLMYHELKNRFINDPRVEFRIAGGEWEFVDVYDLTIGFTHGDSFRYQGGVGGLLIPLRRGFNEMRKYRKLDHMVCGHFHTRTDTGEITVNGSMIGITPYGMHNHCTPEPRQQSWFLIDSTRGKCMSAPAWLL